MNVSVPDPAAQRRLRDALGRFATGVCVVTANGSDGQAMGMTINSFASVSLSPPLVLWSVANASARAPGFVAASDFALHVLAAGQQDLSARFSRGGAGFDGIAVRHGLSGLPILPGCLALFECRTQARHPGGDHTILVGEVMRARHTTGEPLVFFAGSYATLERSVRGCAAT